MKRRGCMALSSALVLACLLGLWQAIIWINHLPAYILPGPLGVVEAIGARYPSLLDSLWITTKEAAGGLAASVVVGLAIAMVFAQWRWLRQTLYPYTILLQTVPIVAIAPLGHPLDRPGNLRRHHRYVHHLPGADHRQHHAGADQRRRESDSTCS